MWKELSNKEAISFYLLGLILLLISHYTESGLMFSFILMGFVAISMTFKEVYGHGYS